MRILLACLNVNGLGGSEMYHYELVRELHKQGVDVTLFTLREIDHGDQVRKRLAQLGIKQVDTHTLSTCNSFDLIVASQPQVNIHLLTQIKGVPIVSIIHSEIRSEDPIVHPQIKHYIVIRESIRKLLSTEYNIPNESISLIYNPIDRSRYNDSSASKFKKITGIFIGGATDDIRFNTVCHLVQHCIENDWDLYIMSNLHQRYSFNSTNVKYVDPCWDNEHLVKKVDFTAGILLGRTTLEGLHCGVPGYVYDIDTSGNIKDIQLIYPNTSLEKVSDSTYVVHQHIELYKKIINENNLQNLRCRI